MKRSMTLMTLILAILALAGIASGEEPKAKTTPTTTTAAVVAAATSHELAVEWALSFITKHAPPGRKTFYTEAQETKEEAEARHRSIAEDLVEVAYNPQNPSVFKGKNGRARTMAVMLGIMLHESGFMRNVDFGVGKFGRGDNGNSWCLMQMNVGGGRAWHNAGGWNIKENRPWRYGDKAEDIVKGASGPEMVQDRRKCFTEALRLIRVSFTSCHNRPFGERLNVYASGTCGGGAAGSRLRLKTATKFWDETVEDRKEFDDASVTKLVVAQLEKRAKDEALAAQEKSKKDDKAKAEKTKPKAAPEARKSHKGPTVAMLP